MTPKQNILDFQAIEKANMTIYALNNLVRFKILNFLLEKGTAYVHEIYRSLELNQSICSQNLRILKQADIISAIKIGRTVQYKVNKDQLVSIAKALNQFYTIGLL